MLDVIDLFSKKKILIFIYYCLMSLKKIGLYL